MKKVTRDGLIESIAKEISELVEFDLRKGLVNKDDFIDTEDKSCPLNVEGAVDFWLDSVPELVSGKLEVYVQDILINLMNDELEEIKTMNELEKEYKREKYLVGR